MKLNIKRNPANGGLYCLFTFYGREFYADLCVMPHPTDYLTECKIFPSENGKVTSWTDIYCKQGIPVTDAALAECIQEFIKIYKSGKKETENK